MLVVMFLKADNVSSYIAFQGKVLYYLEIAAIKFFKR